MKIGVSIGGALWKAEILEKYGYDFAELCVTDFGRYSQTQYDEYRAKIKSLRIPCESANCFLPGDLKLNRLQRDDAAIENYVRLVAERSEEIGIERIVFGSGGARKCPDELSREECTEDIVRFIEKTASPLFKKHGIQLLIEPLASVFCNTVNTVKEGVEIVEKTALDNVWCLADNYHMEHEGEAIETLPLYSGKIVEAHVSSQDVTKPGYGRYFPKENDGYNLDLFVSLLKKCGCEIMVIEAETTDETFEDDAREAIKVIKKAIMKG